jgi:hypothetical protein
VKVQLFSLGLIAKSERRRAVSDTNAWVAVVENVVRGLEPSLEEWLWANNLAIVFTWAQLDGENFTRAPLVALAAVCLYVGALVAVSAASFQWRDIAAAA